MTPDEENARAAAGDDPAAGDYPDSADVEGVETGNDDPSPPTAARRSIRDWTARQRLAAALAGLVVISAAIAGSVFWWVFWPDWNTRQDVQDEVVSAARVGTEAMLSYGPDTLEANLEAAKSHLTGDFLDHYSKFTDEVVTPAAKQRGVKTEANVARAAVSRIQPDQAQVLVFVNQVTTSKDRPTPALATSSVMVTLVKRGGDWLISEFTPV